MGLKSDNNTLRCMFVSEDFECTVTGAVHVHVSYLLSSFSGHFWVGSKVSYKGVVTWEGDRSRIMHGESDFHSTLVSIFPNTRASTACKS